MSPLGWVVVEFPAVGPPRIISDDDLIADPERAAEVAAEAATPGVRTAVVAVVDEEARNV